MTCASYWMRYVMANVYIDFVYDVKYMNTRHT